MTSLSVSKKNSRQEIQGACTMDYVGRTQGDGMENVSVDKTESKPTKIRLGETFIYHPTNLKQTNSSLPVTPTGTIVNLIPKNIKDHRHIPNTLKPKEPKFVPYEPYKAAVNPIVPLTRKGKQRHKSELNAGVIVSQVGKMKLSESNVNANESIRKGDDKQLANDWSEEKKKYEARMQKLEEENNQLQNQLKFQAQVNGELKNLLVAAVGEDLETKVHLLTEDKLQLAQALLNSAQHLNTHQEQTEWLAGQCEVWRSKFLASSLMVEELAKCKAALCQKTTDLQEAITKLLEERNKIQELSLKTYRILRILRENFDPAGAASCRNHKLPSLNILDLAQGCHQLTDILNVQLLSGMPFNVQKEINIADLETKTSAEKTAEQLVASANALESKRQDVACNAVMGAAVAIGGQMFYVQKDPCITCPHCSGEIKQI